MQQSIYNAPGITIDERLTVDVVNIKYRPLTRTGQVVRNKISEWVKPKKPEGTKGTISTFLNKISTNFYNDLNESVSDV